MLPYNGCQCDAFSQIIGAPSQNPKGCSRSASWLRYANISTNEFGMKYAKYKTYLTQRSKESQSKLKQIIDDIEMDLERTFIESPYFNQNDNK